MEIVIATTNTDKLREIISIVNGYPGRFSSLEKFLRGTRIRVPDISETGKSFAENALIKAKKVFELTGIASLADDTGLVVPSLKGYPGVFSARYAVSENDKRNLSKEEIYALNREKLLKNLEGVSDRKAFFVCHVALMMVDGRVLHGEGRCHGFIGFSEKGTGGFGYDSLFVVEGVEKTFAELSLSEKNRLGHRGVALRELFENFTHL